MAILVILALFVVGALLLILPALLPGIVIGAIGFMIYRLVEWHHHAVEHHPTSWGDAARWASAPAGSGPRSLRAPP